MLVSFSFIFHFSQIWDCCVYFRHFDSTSSSFILQSDCVSSVFHQVVNVIIGSMKQVQNAKTASHSCFNSSQQRVITVITHGSDLSKWVRDSGCAQKRQHVDSTSMIKSPDSFFIHINKWRLDRISFFGKLWQSLLSVRDDPVSWCLSVRLYRSFVAWWWILSAIHLMPLLIRESCVSATISSTLLTCISTSLFCQSEH